jgi:hypothetical protein
MNLDESCIDLFVTLSFSDSLLNFSFSVIIHPNNLQIFNISGSDVLVLCSYEIMAILSCYKLIIYFQEQEAIANCADNTCTLKV